MTLPKHKAAAYTEQIQQHGPMTSTYGQEKGKVTKRRQFMNRLVETRSINRLVDAETQAAGPEMSTGQNEAYRKRATIYAGSDERARRKGDLGPNEGLGIWTGSESVPNTPENRQAHPFGRSNEAWSVGKPRKAGDRTIRRTEG